MNEESSSEAEKCPSKNEIRSIPLFGDVCFDIFIDVQAYI
jgi:hypothetical protein